MNESLPSIYTMEEIKQSFGAMTASGRKLPNHMSYEKMIEISDPRDFEKMSPGQGDEKKQSNPQGLEIGKTQDSFRSSI